MLCLLFFRFIDYDVYMFVVYYDIYNFDVIFYIDGVFFLGEFEKIVKYEC